MKKTAKFLVILLVLTIAASAVSAFAFGEFGSNLTADDYDKYGYYTYYDFESYTGGHPLDYFRDTSTKNASGLISDPFGLICQTQGVVFGTGIVQNDGDNTYVHYIHKDGSYSAVAVFEAVDKNGNDAILGDSVELSFRLRMSANQAKTDTKMRVINIRRNGDNLPYVLADVYGNLYVQTASNKSVLVYTNGDGKTVGGDGEFKEIAFRWYDTTNTFSLYVNGRPVAEAIPFYKQYNATGNFVDSNGKNAASTKVRAVYDDYFGVSDLEIVSGTTSESTTRTIEFIRPDANVAFEFDLDDLKLSRIETAQKGAVYYENSFESQKEGISSLLPYGTYIYNNSASDDNIYLGYDKADGWFLEVSEGQFVSLNDTSYQAFTQGNLVVEFSIKGNPTHNEGYKGLIRFNESSCLNCYNPLVVDPYGNLYIAYTYSSSGKDIVAYDRIDGYKLDGREWLDIAVVAIKNTDNYGKFSSFSKSNFASSVNDSYFFTVYINGELVGATMAQEYLRFGASGYDNKKITASNYEYTITDFSDASALDLTSLTLVDGTTTENHKIYKSVEDGVVTYYDVTFDMRGNKVAYSAMVLGKQVAGGENLCILADYCFDAKLDNIKVYEGTAPEGVYAAANSADGGRVLDIDFSKFTFATNSVEVKTASTGSGVLGSFVTSGFYSKNSTHKTSDGTVTTEENTRDTDYATLSFDADSRFDYFVPMPYMSSKKFDFTYSFEAVVKNFNFDNEYIELLALCLENDITVASSSLFKVDKNLNVFAGATAVKLYDASGNALKLDNADWNSLRADVRFTKDADGLSASVSYFYNDQPLFLANGNEAADITNVLSSGVQDCIGSRNVRLSLTPQPSAGNTLCLDAKSLTVMAKVRPAYITFIGNSRLDDGISVIELSLKKYTGAEVAARYDAVSILNNGEAMPLIALDPEDGSIFVGSDGSYYKLYSKKGNEFKLGNDAVPVKVVYDGIGYDARYYINNELAYIMADDGELVPTTDLALFDSAPEAGGGFVLFSGYGESDSLGLNAEDYGLKLYNIGESDTAGVVCIKESKDNRSIKLISGVNTLLYNSVGFELETFVNGVSKGVKCISDNVVFESVDLDGSTIMASEQGYAYLATAVITGIPKNIRDQVYIQVRSYTEIGGIKHYNSEVRISVTSDGCSFDYSQVVKNYVDFIVDVEEGRDIRVLQLSDIQTISSIQKRYDSRISSFSEANTYSGYEKYISQVIEKYDPDFIIITGDNVYGEFDDSGEQFIKVIEFMDSFEIPWAPVFGNHDNESNMGVDWQCEQFENSEYCLFKQRELTGNGNYTVGIMQGGELKRVFYMLDSNGSGNMSEISYSNGHSKKTAGFGQDQIEWYSESMEDIKRVFPDAKLSMAFHIQLAVFEDAFKQYGYDSSTIADNPINLDELDSARAVGDFGVIGRALKSVWDKDYIVWDTIKKYGVDSVFVGHEHCNSASVTYEGVRLTYSQKSSTYDRYNLLQEDGSILDSQEAKGGTPIIGGSFFDLSSNDGSIVDAGLLLYSDDGTEAPQKPAMTIDTIPEDAIVSEFDVSGSGFDATVRTPDMTSYASKAVSDLSSVPTGYSGGVYSKTSANAATFGVKFTQPINADRLLAIFVKMYIGSYTVESGKNPLIRVYGESSSSVLGEVTFSSLGGETGEWIYINILDIVKGASGIIENGRLNPFTLSYRFYGSDKGIAYFDSVTLVSNGDIYTFDNVDNSDGYEIVRGEKCYLYTANEFEGVTGTLNGGSSRFMTIKDESCSVKFSLTPTAFDGTLGIYGFTNKNNPSSGIGVKLTKTGAVITSGRGTGTIALEVGKTYEVEVGFVSLFNGNTVYTFIRIDGKLVAWELVEGYGKIAGNIAIVSTNSSDSFSIS